MTPTQLGTKTSLVNQQPFVHSQTVIMGEDKGPNLVDLPTEILLHICNFLEGGFVRSVLSRVNRRLAQLVTDPVIWKLRISNRWPAKYPPIAPEEPPWDWARACSVRESFTNQWSKYESSKEKARVRGHYSSVDTVLLMGQGLLVTGSRDRSIALWDTQEMTANNDGTNSTGLIQKWTDVHKGWVWSLSKDANCATTLVSCGWDSKANIWRLTNSEMVLQASINCSTALLCSDIHSASGLVVVGTFDKRVKMFDLRSSTPTVAEFKHHKMPVLSVCALPNDSYGVISASEDGTLAKMDTRTKKVVSRLYFKNGGGFPMCMGLMEGCTCLVVGDKIGGLHLVDTNKMQEIKVLPNLHDGKITGIDVSIGGIVTCSTDGKVKILQPDISLATIATIEDKDFGDVTAVSMNNDILATGSSLEMVQIWRPKTDDNSNAVVMAT